MTGLAAAISAEAQILAGYFTAFVQDLAEIRLTGPRARLAASAALTVALATTAALALHLDNVWWASISGFMSSQASLPASVKKVVLRIIGTAAGATLALIMAPWLLYDQVACCLFLMFITTIGILGVQVSPHGYAWLFTAITFDLVLLMSLNEPLAVFHLGVYRVLEVIVGSVCAVLVAALFAQEEEGPAPPVPPGWTDFFGAQWPALLHAVRSGITVAVIPLVWTSLEVENISQMAVTAAIVMAVPILSYNQADQGRLIVTRAIHRLIGCLIGGIAALICLALPLTDFLPWIATLSAAVYVGTYVQQSERGIGYIGTQAAFVFIITLVQGFEPASNIWPGIDRFGGMMGGLLILLIVSLLLWPSADEPPPGETLQADR
jgi:uncharacterized membrane protein YccC